MQREKNYAEFDFGDLVTERGGGAVKWVLGIALLCGAGALIVSSYVQNARTGKDMFALIAIGFILIAPGIFIVQLARMRTAFYLRGVVVRRGGKVLKWMPYDACDEFAFGIERQYYNGFYAGTAISLQLKGEGWPTIAWTGRHKEKPQGMAFTVFGKQFKGEDELDLIKELILDQVVAKWNEKIEAGEKILWKNLEFGTGGITPQRGAKKGIFIPYDQIVIWRLSPVIFELRVDGEKAAFSTLIATDSNFLVALDTLSRFGGRAEQGHELRSSFGA